MLASGRRAQHLAFLCTPALGEQVNQLNQEPELVSVRITGRVENLLGGTTGRAQVVTVTRI